MINFYDNIESATLLNDLLANVPLPNMVKIKNTFARPVLKDLPGELLQKLRGKDALGSVREGDRIAVAVGSRGISNIPLIVKTIVQEIKNIGAEPFLVPAMGSHGGATAEGQEILLSELGITESSIGAPVFSSMETVILEVTGDGVPVYCDKLACEADGVIIINRIKPHISFRGKYESGLMKMLAIGLGKQKGADLCHSFGFERIGDAIHDLAKIFLQKAKVLFAVGLVENAYHETSQIEVLLKEEIESREPALLDDAKRLSPKLYFDTFDVLIIDEIGKDISGTGFDTNIVGRYHSSAVRGGPQIKRVAILDLTEKSHGNANGIGPVDFITKRLFDKIDFGHTYMNAITTSSPASVKIPLVLPNDRRAIQAAIKTCHLRDLHKVKLVRIKNTLELGVIEVSESLLPEVDQCDAMKVFSLPYHFSFNARGDLF